MCRLSMSKMNNDARVHQFNRRRFIQASALIGGGMVLGLAVPGTLPGRKSGPTSLNAYVRIDSSGRVTLVMPKVEMGQGTYTSLPMLIAEELEVGLDAITLEAAPPDPAVYGFDGDQSTGGSAPIRQCWLPLRKAGAAARSMLIVAAAKKWGVEPSSCRAELGNVIHERSGRRLTYGHLATAAASVPVPADPPLKAAKDFKLIGRATPRRDTPDKTNGRAVFGIDVRLDGMRIAMVALSPVSGGTVVEPLNTSAALAIPGVRQVVNERNLLAVVADDTWASLKGLKALNLRWNDGPHGSVQQQMIVADLEAAARRAGAVAGHAGQPAGTVGPRRPN